jgi:hypothetical protein
MKLLSPRIMLACCAISLLVLLLFPAIDLAVSAMFFDGRFDLRNRW